MKAVGLTLVLAACSNGSLGRRPATHDDTSRRVPAVANPLVVDAGLAPVPWPDRPDTFAAALRGMTPGPLVLVADAKGIVVRGVDGPVRAQLVTGAVTQPRYDAELGVLWFVHAPRLEALDLGGPRGDSVPVVDAMPPLPFDVVPCDVCLRIDLDAEAISVEHHPDPERAIQTDVKKAVRIAEAAHPMLTDEGRRFLASLHDRLGQPRLTRFPALDTSTTLPVPPAAGDLARCDHAFSPRRGCCVGGCRHGFDPPGLGRQLVVAGRRCDCTHDRCEALCVWRDPTTGRFAALDHPEHWGRDATPRPCTMNLDAAGSAYLFDHQVCSARGCAPLHGDALGWLTPGMTIFGLPEDISACPE